MYGDWQLSGVYLIFNFYGDLEILLSENGLDVFFSFKRLKKAHSQSTWDNKDSKRSLYYSTVRYIKPRKAWLKLSSIESLKKFLWFPLANIST